MFKLALGAGHGFNTAGKRCPKELDSNETREWWLNDRVADKVEGLLAGYADVAVLRLDDSDDGADDIALATRVKRANQWGADFYLSVHHNAGICGGSAIAAIAPTIDADDNDVAYAMSATFLFDMAMIVLFPIMGRALGMTDQAFGIWAGTAVNDTSSVVATGYAFSEAAGDFATMVKLTRTLAIIPTVIVFALVQLNLKRKEAMALQQDGSALKAEFSIKKIFPWFILGFLAMSIVASILPIPAQLVSGTKTASKFLMVCALAAIGLNTSFASMKKAGIRPMIHGFIISALVVIVALLVEMGMGIV